MTSRVAVPIFAVLVALAALGYCYLQVDGGAAPPSDPPAQEVSAAEPSPAPPLLSAPAPVRTPQRPQEMIRYPDGTYMPALNGVRNPPPLQWPSDLPFTPIVGKRVSAGVEWYVHADGTQTTTQMVFRSDLGREDATIQIARPRPALPVEPPDPPARN